MSVEPHTRMQKASFLVAHSYPGRLITAEGLDGSGKSTQLQLLSFWLRSEGYETVFAEWAPSKLIKRALKKGRKHGSLNPGLLSLLHGADFAEIYQREIVPALQRGAVVLVDRYVYTAVARDLARGVVRDRIEHLYQFAVRPDLSVYFQISVQQSLDRTLHEHLRLRYYQAGMDLRLSDNPIESFRTFQQRLLEIYESMVKPCALLRLNAMLPVHQQQRVLREAVLPHLPRENEASHHQ